MPTPRSPFPDELTFFQPWAEQFTVAHDHTMHENMWRSLSQVGRNDLAAVFDIMNSAEGRQAIYRWCSIPSPNETTLLAQIQALRFLAFIDSLTAHSVTPFIESTNQFLSCNAKKGIAKTFQDQNKNLLFQYLSEECLAQTTVESVRLSQRAKSISIYSNVIGFMAFLWCFDLMFISMVIEENFAVIGCFLVGPTFLLPSLLALSADSFGSLFHALMMLVVTPLAVAFQFKLYNTWMLKAFDKDPKKVLLLGIRVAALHVLFGIPAVINRHLYIFYYRA